MDQPGTAPHEAPKLEGMKAFLTVWIGQVVSLLGTGLTGFALGVWVYQRTGSVTQFALILFFGSLPGLVLAPLAGALVDRWNRRTTLIASDAAAAVITLILLLLLWDESKNLLELWHLYLLTAIASVAGSVQWPAFSAATTLLVAKEHYGRASGLAQMAGAIAQIASPVLGAFLLLQVHLRGILLIDLATFGVAFVTWLLVRIPEPVRPPGGPATSLRQEAATGWTYLRERPGLLALLILFACTNFNVGMLQALLPPLVLSFAPATTLGSMLSAAGFGLLAGTLLTGAWGGPKRRITGIFAGLLVQGLLLLVIGWRPSAILIGAATFVFLAAAPVVNGCSQAIWQVKVPAGLQGRVFAVRRMVAQCSLPLAFFLAGPLADRVFEPLLAPQGPLAGSLGAVLGTGPGRGLGFLFIVLGLLVVAGLLFATTLPRLRRVEEELPDAEVAASGTVPGSSTS